MQYYNYNKNSHSGVLEILYKICKHNKYLELKISVIFNRCIHFFFLMANVIPKETADNWYWWSSISTSG